MNPTTTTKAPARQIEYRISVPAHIYVSVFAPADKPLTDDEAKAAAVALVEEAEGNSEHLDGLAEHFNEGDDPVVYLARDLKGKVDMAEVGVEDVLTDDDEEDDDQR